MKIHKALGTSANPSREQHVTSLPLVLIIQIQFTNSFEWKKVTNLKVHIHQPLPEISDGLMVKGQSGSRTKALLTSRTCWYQRWLSMYLRSVWSHFDFTTVDWQLSLSQLNVWLKWKYFFSDVIGQEADDPQVNEILQNIQDGRNVNILEGEENYQNEERTTNDEDEIARDVDEKHQVEALVPFSRTFHS